MRAFDELAEVRAAFREWPSIAVKGFLWKHLDLPRRELRVHSRGSSTLVAPLVRNVGALYTAVDVFAFGAYACDWEIEDKPCVIDIGANIGAWVIWLAEQRPHVHGIAFEPDGEAASYLRRNLELNGLADRIDVQEVAISGQTGTARLFQARPGEGTSSLRPKSHAATFERETVVPTLSLDDAIADFDAEVSLVKMDCEGAEYDIVNASSLEAWNRIRRVVVEYHPAEPTKLNALRVRFHELGYSVLHERHRSANEGTLWLARTLS
jgi:FkbM family methyltransferase